MHYKIYSCEMCLLFPDGEFRGLLASAKHRGADPLGEVRVDDVRQRE